MICCYQRDSKNKEQFKRKSKRKKTFLEGELLGIPCAPWWAPDKVGMITPHFAVESLRPSLRVKQCVGGPPPLGWGVLFNLLASHIFCFPIMTECFWCKFRDYSQHRYFLWS